MRQGNHDTSRGSSASFQKPPVVLEGLAGSAGYCIGPALVVDTRRPGIQRRRIQKHQAEDEIARFDAAVAEAAKGFREIAERLQKGAESSILEAYVMMIQDPTLREDVERRVRIDRQSAEWALDNAIRDMTSELVGRGDPYLAERGHDFEFIEDRILRSMGGRQKMLSIPDGAPAGILVARDLSPAETAGLSREQVLGMVTEVGTRTSHTAILARALELPAVVGAAEALLKIGHGDIVIVDGVHGRVVVRPTPEMIREMEGRRARHRALSLDLRHRHALPATSRCGQQVDVKANIELPEETVIAIEQGAQGVGLYRTEFLYVNREEPPTEDEQYEVYRHVVEVMSPLGVTLRTFDIGGDKFASSFQVPAEMNPALGLRAVRLGLERPDLFMTQLRATLRASAHGKLSIMLPMVAVMHELREVKRMFEEARQQVAARGHAMAEHVSLGIMVEVPSAAVMADHFAKEADFLSIGTNDLVQYSLAVDRSNRQLAKLGSFFDPALLRLVQGVIDAGRRHTRPVSVCGAMASDPLAAILLLGMGLRDFSMEASAIPEVKEAISRVTVLEAQEAARACVAQVDAASVEEILAQAFAPRMADLLDRELV